VKRLRPKIRLIARHFLYFLPVDALAAGRGIRFTHEDALRSLFKKRNI
jgi:hypothetical protein